MPRSLLLLSMCLLLLYSCGDEKGTQETSETSDGTIVVTTNDGSVIEFTDFQLSCPDTNNWWGQDAKVVQAIAGAYGAAGHRGDDGMMLTARAGLAERISIPHVEEWGRYETFVLAFVTRASKATELSSAVEESSGEIEVVSASCDPQPSLELKIDGVLASETGNGKATVSGHLKLG